MKITIRPATPADAQRCAEIHIRSWDAAYTGRIPQECIERARARRPSLWSTIIPTANNQSHYVIADGDTGEIAGFFVIEPARDADLPASVLELTSLCIWIRPSCAAVWGGQPYNGSEQRLRSGISTRSAHGC